MAPTREAFESLSGWGLALAAIGVALAQLALYWRDTLDDLFITLRYARNWAEGLGPVYNSGERVEGYSNPLLVALLALAVRLGLDPLVVAKAISVLAFAGIWFVLQRLVVRSVRSGASPLLLAVPGLTVLSTFSLCFFSISGLEALPLGFVVLMIGVCSARRRYGAALTLGALACWLRPEGPMYVAVPLITLLRAERWSVRQALHALLRHWLAATFLLAVLCGGLLLRRAYYGAWLPNTFFAKAPWTQGTNFPWWLWPMRGIDDMAIIAAQCFLPALALGLAWQWRRLDRAVLVAAGSVIALGLAFQKYSGGDWMLGARFLVPDMPLLALLWVEVARHPLAQRGNVSRRLVAGIVASGLIVLVIRCNDALEFVGRRPFYPANQMTSVGLAETGQWIAAELPAEWTMWCPAIGVAGYVGKLRIADPQGLVSAQVAQALSHSFSPEARQSAVETILHDLSPEAALEAPPEFPLTTRLFGSRRYRVAHVGHNGVDPHAVYVREDLWESWQRWRASRGRSAPRSSERR